MIDFIVRQLFKWHTLKVHIFSEVDWYNSITRTLNDPESMRTAVAIWCEQDGWRGWNYDDEKNKYYFHDLPEKSIYDIIDVCNQ